MALAEERLESGKAAAISAVCGSLLMAPAALLATDSFSPQWEFAHDALALQLFLFGVVYRYAVRQDESVMLKQGAVGAFVVTRSLAAIQVSTECTAMPLRCGPPLGYLDFSMIAQGAGWAAESALAFGGAALALEFAFNKGWLQRLPADGLPSE